MGGYLSVARIVCLLVCVFFFNDTATTEIYTLSLHDALPIWPRTPAQAWRPCNARTLWRLLRSEEHTSELQSLRHLVCRLLLEKKHKHTHSRQARNQECRRAAGLGR